MFMTFFAGKQVRNHLESNFETAKIFKMKVANFALLHLVILIKIFVLGKKYLMTLLFSLKGY